jgi:hypothetical protein
MLLRPNAGDCCVFYSFGSVKCPLIQQQLDCSRQCTDRTAKWLTVTGVDTCETAIIMKPARRHNRTHQYAFQCVQNAEQRLLTPID